MRMLRFIGALLAVSAIGGGVALAASSPSVATGGTTKPQQRSVELLGTVNPNGKTTYFNFDFGLTTAYGDTTKTRTVGSGTRPVAVHAVLLGLLPGTVYHYRLAALSKAGGALGRDRTFKTAGAPPAGASTGPASGVTQTGATLTGEVATQGVATSWHFTYSVGSAPGSQTLTKTIPAGEKVPLAVSYPLTGLAPGTIYTVQLVATNRGVTTTGAPIQFMTLPSPTPHPNVSARTRPRHPRHRPFVFTTTGSVSRPSSIPAQYACAGTVRVRFWLGRHKVAEGFAPLASTCTFSAQTVFSRRPGRHAHGTQKLKVYVHYDGDGYLGAATSRAGHVKLG